MELSVVVVSWNVAELLRECLVSLEQHLATHEVETIVVDNASSDATVRMLCSEFPQVRVIANEGNVGFAAAANQGVRASGGRLVLLLNPDARLTEDSFARLCDALEGHAGAGVAGPRLVDGAGRPALGAGGSFPTPATVLATALGLHRLFPRSRWSRGICLSRDEPERREIDWVSGACMLVRREVLSDVGGFDERFFLLCEDVDFCRRAREVGWTTLYVPETTVVHHEGSSIGRQDDELLLANAGSLRAYLAARHGRLASALILLPLRLNYTAKLAVLGASYLVRRTPAGRHRLLLVRKHLRILAGRPPRPEGRAA